MGAETNTTTASRPSRSATGTLTVPAPAQREREPISWTTGTTTPAVSRAGARAARPEPRMRQLMGVCGWAAVLGGVGLVIGIRGLIGILAGDPPGWFEPAMAGTGALGIGLTVGAFLTVHRSRAPWILLGAASVVLLAAMAVTSKAL